MAITKAKKEEIIKEGAEQLNDSEFLVFADFRGTNVHDIHELRMKLRESGLKFKVIKKRLLKIILQNKKIDFDPVKLDGQIGMVFGEGDISSIASPVYDFSKEHKTFKIIGGVNLGQKEEVPLDKLIAIGQLPSREVLLGQVLGVITAPLRGLMYIFSEKAKSEAT